VSDNIRIETETIYGKLITTVIMDAAGKPVNTCAPAMLAELDAAVAMIEQQRPAAVIFASAKAKSFNAGADLFEIRKMSGEEVAAYLEQGQVLFTRIERLSMPTVAAINGDCMGGGFELSLACKYRVAADDTKISIGLPETKLGLIPAWGGTTRLPRLLGLTKALPILLGGKTMPPRKAQKSGLVHEVVRPEALMSAARRLALHGTKTRKPKLLDRTIASVTKLRQRALDSARRQTLETTFSNYPAPVKLLDVVETGYAQGKQAGFDAERQALIDLSNAPTGRNLLRIFFLRQGAKKRATEPLHAKPLEIKHAAVIGGGTMGAGIVHALVRAGIPVRLVEVNAAAVGGALARIQKMLDDDVAMGKLDKIAARHTFNRVSPTTEWTGLELADIVVEAVLETMPAKREVFARLDQLTKPTCVLATNTSSLRVSEIAQATLHPERVVGLHFFNPVNKMPLVEIVRGAQSDDVSLATAVALTSRIGKTPVLTADASGFLVNRVLIPYLAEALNVASEGAAIPLIDRAMKQWGMPMGPFELLDEIGLDIGAHVLKSLGPNWPQPANVSNAIELASQKKWLGKKTGIGFYKHAQQKRGKKPVPPALNEELAKVLAPQPVEMDMETIQWRLMLPMVNEAAALLDERVVDSTETIDLAMVMGTGLAPFRGGIVHFAEDHGLDKIVTRLEGLAAKHGARFEPARLLRDAAQNHKLLQEQASQSPQQERTSHAYVQTR
jgi:3-hydroxyacyl-CoA dehydrogenase/enoyl-CoA hydratase/3-hydroxybutyryl-CoA epimerase